MSYTSSCPFKRTTKATTIFRFFALKDATAFAINLHNKVVPAYNIKVISVIDFVGTYSCEFRSEDLTVEDNKIVLKLAKKHKAIGNY